MIQAFILLFSFIVILPAHAAPAVGDQVAYTAIHLQNGKSTNFVITNEITALDATAQTANVLQTIMSDGKLVSSGTNPTPLKEIAYPDDATIATCGIVSYPGQTGTPETITVPAGTFKACHIVLNQQSPGTEGEYDAAAVPFGFVKSISTTSTGTMTVELNSFQSAKAP